MLRMRLAMSGRYSARNSPKVCRPMRDEPAAEIGVFGGSGFYCFLPEVEEFRAHTPYGAPSDKLALATMEGKRIAFLPRHGREHSVPAHRVNYRANIWALKELGVAEILAPF